MKGLRPVLLSQKPSPTMMSLRLAWDGNLRVVRNKRKGNKSLKKTIPICNSWRKNRRFAASLFFSVPSLIQNCLVQKHRRRLVQELSARMERDQQLRYAERELEMQRLLMGKGRMKKLKGVEVVKDEGDDEEDGEEDGGRPGRSTRKIYKPRMYKWKVERKR